MSLVKTPLYYEEMKDTIIKKNIFKKKDKKMSKEKKETKDNRKNTLSIYTYLNMKRFGISIAIDNGIKVNIAFFETHIKFEKR